MHIPAVDNKAFCHSGATSCEVFAVKAPKNSLNAAAQAIANHFMANLNSFEFKDDRAHATNLAATAGIYAGASNFVVDRATHATKSAPQSPSGPVNDQGGRVV